MNNNQVSEPNPGPLAQGCPPPTSVLPCNNAPNLPFLPCQDASVDMMDPAAAIIEYTNRLRSNLNSVDGMRRPNLLPNESLAIGARFKANEMVRYNYFGHCFNGRNAVGLANQLRQTDSNLWTNCIGENLHRKLLTSYEVFAGWFCSLPHFNAMTNPEYDRIGIGFAPSNQEPDGNKWVMWLASSSSKFNCFQSPSTEWVQRNGRYYYYVNCIWTGWLWVDGITWLYSPDDGITWYKSELKSDGTRQWFIWNGTWVPL